MRKCDNHSTRMLYYTFGGGGIVHATNLTKCLFLIYFFVLLLAQAFLLHPQNGNSPSAGLLFSASSSFSSHSTKLGKPAPLVCVCLCYVMDRHPGQDASHVLSHTSPQIGTGVPKTLNG